MKIHSSQVLGIFSALLLVCVASASASRLLQTTVPADNCNVDFCKVCTVPPALSSCLTCSPGSTKTLVPGTTDIYNCVAKIEPCLKYYDDNDELFGGCNNCKDGFGKDQGVMVGRRLNFECLTLITPIDGCLNYKTISQCAICEKDYLLKGTEVCERLQQAEKIINCDVYKQDNYLPKCLKCAPGYVLNVQNYMTCELPAPENEGCSALLTGRCIACDGEQNYSAKEYSTAKGAVCKKFGFIPALSALLFGISLTLVF